MKLDLLHDFFEASARRWPDHFAVDVPPGNGRPERLLVTYAELNNAANRLACEMRASIVGECVVAILLPRDSSQLYAAQLAVLKAGAAYTCLDPSFPDERIVDVLEDAEAVHFLVQTK